MARSTICWPMAVLRALAHWRRRRCVAAALIFGAVRMRQVDAIVARAPRLNIGLVQPNFAYTTNGDLSGEEALRQLTALQSQSVRLQRAGAQLVVWSEGAYPVDPAAGLSPPTCRPASLGMIRRGFNVPAVIGAEMVDPARADAYNSALLLDGDGRLAGRYDKVRLLAFGEYIPGIDAFPWLRKFLPEGIGRFTAGKGPAVMTLRGVGGQRLEIGSGDLLRGHFAGVLAQRRTAASQPAGQSDQRLMVRRRHRALGTSRARGVRQRRAARRHGARREFRRFRANRSERPAAAKNLCRRSLSCTPAPRTVSWSRRHRCPAATPCTLPWAICSPISAWRRLCCSPSRPPSLHAETVVLVVIRIGRHHRQDDGMFFQLL